MCVREETGEGGTHRWICKIAEPEKEKEGFGGERRIGVVEKTSADGGRGGSPCQRRPWRLQPPPLARLSWNTWR